MNGTIARADDNDRVLFIDGPEAGRQGLQPDVGDRVSKTVAQLRENYRRIVGQIIAMTAETPNDDETLRLKTVQVGLGFSAEGELGFIVKATVGVEATVTLTFERG